MFGADQHSVSPVAALPSSAAPGLEAGDLLVRHILGQGNIWLGRVANMMFGAMVPNISAREADKSHAIGRIPAIGLQ
ncbi:hypothetical protein BLTE_07290 [Blastochloris tepida]|uniref:Uncharacterized protein n=1 Tax=Blastochloris tepida TaxID=2233851 RepID=A0A348FXL1_9HYPH|nr:hypothetical protein BLTE_07290 [Blastochloris tepida]